MEPSAGIQTTLCVSTAAITTEYRHRFHQHSIHQESSVEIILLKVNFPKVTGLIHHGTMESLLGISYTWNVRAWGDSPGGAEGADGFTTTTYPRCSVPWTPHHQI